MNSSFNCQNFNQLLDFYLDDQLEQEEITLFNDHKSNCSHCKKTFAIALIVQRSLESTMNEEIDVSKELSDQMWANIQARTIHKKQPKQRIASVKKWGRWTPIPLMAIAGLLFFISTTGFKDPLLQSAKTLHTEHWPTEIETGQVKEVKAWFKKQKLEIPHFGFSSHEQAKLNIARLSMITVSENKWKKAAHFLYSIPVRGHHHRLTVLAFPGVRHPLEDAQHHLIENIPVSLSRSSQFNLAYYSDGKMSYVLTSDLPSKQMLRLIRSDLRLRRLRH
jgi:anti-sigma factor RsiW